MAENDCCRYCGCIHSGVVCAIKWPVDKSKWVSVD